MFGSSLQRLAEIAHELGSERVAEDASALAERVAEGRFMSHALVNLKTREVDGPECFAWRSGAAHRCCSYYHRADGRKNGRTRSARVRFHGGNWLDVSQKN